MKIKKNLNWKKLKILKSWNAESWNLEMLKILKILKYWNLENLENWKKGLKIMDFLKCSSVDFPKLWLNNIDVFLMMSCPWLRLIHWITLLFILFSSKFTKCWFKCWFCKMSNSQNLQIFFFNLLIWRKIFKFGKKIFFENLLN